MWGGACLGSRKLVGRLSQLPSTTLLQESSLPLPSLTSLADPERQGWPCWRETHVGRGRGVLACASHVSPLANLFSRPWREELHLQERPLDTRCGPAPRALCGLHRCGQASWFRGAFLG